jgi:hypothetical protein
LLGARSRVALTTLLATAVSIWAGHLLERKPARLVTVAVANKIARIAWAVIPGRRHIAPLPSWPENPKLRQFGQRRTIGVMLIRSSRRSEQPA